LFDAEGGEFPADSEPWRRSAEALRARAPVLDAARPEARQRTGLPTGRSAGASAGSGN